MWGDGENGSGKRSGNNKRWCMNGEDGVGWLMWTLGGWPGCGGRTPWPWPRSSAQVGAGLHACGLHTWGSPIAYPDAAAASDASSMRKASHAVAGSARWPYTSRKWAYCASSLAIWGRGFSGRIVE